ncbi:TIGR03936 family radical SAM-associated protein [Iamia majanohamensis]|uniref:TIGR03936 family radical SAM-associated protein n=1 Tax=Iamia majanohamensis TaxID=467976 RepID=A0AAF0BXC6_9ACTN|nr:TIGR03936 family radical SAM-associated protein [Iamia majanohamensis]WCO68858.1 TIGR03936 family radical SAM-associated protein [Iamia majanohamensis]
MRLRIRFTKQGKVRFTSHRDVARIWERTLRRVALPVARSQGFSPRPKVHFGLALPTGYESLAEYLDVDLVEGTHVDAATLPGPLTAALPGGLAATAAAEVDPRAPSLQHAVTSSRWEIEVTGLDLPTLEARCEDLLAAPELVMARQRKGKDVSDDVRPHLFHLQPTTPVDGGALLIAELGTLGRALRPRELVALLGVGAGEGKVCRTHQFTEHDGTRSEPLTPLAAAAPAAAPGPVSPADHPSPAPHAEARAS